MLRLNQLNNYEEKVFGLYIFKVITLYANRNYIEKVILIHQWVQIPTRARAGLLRQSRTGHAQGNPQKIRHQNHWYWLLPYRFSWGYKGKLTAYNWAGNHHTQYTRSSSHYQTLGHPPGRLQDLYDHGICLQWQSFQIPLSAFVRRISTLHISNIPNFLPNAISHKLPPFSRSNASRSEGLWLLTQP